MCAPRVTRHTLIRYSSCYHTRVNMLTEHVVRNFLITPSTVFTKYVTMLGTSWSHLLQCLRNMWQCSELLDHTFCIVYEICDSIQNFLITPSVLFTKYVTVFGTSWSTFCSVYEMCQCSEILDHTFCIVYEICVNIRNFLITPSVLFSKYVTVFGTSWSHLLYCLRNMWQYSELLDHTFCTVFEICDSIRNFLITPVLFSKYVTVFDDATWL